MNAPRITPSNNSFAVIYGLIALMVLLSLGMQKGYPQLHLVAKPLIMISLMGNFLWQIRSIRARPVWMFIAALFFSWLGDVLLMFGAQPLFFVLGLGAFLLAHIGYCISFLATDARMSEEPVLLRKPRAILLFMVYFAIMLAALWPGLGDLKVPVIIYAAAITCMIALALNRWKRVPQGSFAPVFAGAMLFVLSDSVLALNKFVVAIPLAPFWIMSTYMAAQYLIVQGMAAFVREQE